MNSFQIFNDVEMKKIILLDSEVYHSKDIRNIHIYANMVFNLTQGSLSEYHHYKKAWNWIDRQCSIPEKNFEEIKENYIKMRKDFIRKSETKFREEKIKDMTDLMNYLDCLRKFRIYNNYKAIRDVDEKANLYLF